MKKVRERFAEIYDSINSTILKMDEEAFSIREAADRDIALWQVSERKGYIMNWHLYEYMPAFAPQYGFLRNFILRRADYLYKKWVK
jgi:hypothetical protein